METRTSYILVGAFLLAAATLLIAFINWSVKSDSRTKYTIYRAYFTGSVSGLNETGEVRYRGIPIGQVIDIRIDPDNVELIRVTMRIVATTPIKEDSIASIEQQGITGVADVQISGGSQAAPALQRKEGRKFPVIEAKRSQLEALFTDTPELIARIMKLTDSVASLFTDENRVAIAGTLTNLEVLTGSLADSSQRIAEFVDDAAAVAGELRMAADKIDGLMTDARGTFASAESTLQTIDTQVSAIGGSAKSTIAEFGRTARSLNDTTALLSATIEENRKPLRDFMGEGLYDMTQLIVEMRGLIASLSRIAERLESDPSLFLFGRPQKGYEAK
jgi:phospholipid/cholesterol/gamma-HCH transport system substrate-binding protein